MELQKFEFSDSKLEHSSWRFPSVIKTRPLRDLDDEEDFLKNHKIDRSYDDSTVKFKLLVGNAIKANLLNTTQLPLDSEVHQIVKKQGWISEEYEHLWRREGGGSAALFSHGILTFLLQTPRDGKSFCSLSLVNRERSHCGGMYIADEHYSLDTLLSSQPYLNRHPKVPKDLGILPLQILTHHIEETLSSVHKVSRELTSAEKRIADGHIALDENGDYKLLNRLNLEHLRLQRRSNFELELAANLLKYIDEYHRMWSALWEGGASYIDEMREKLEQQSRYADQVQLDLEVIPRRIKNQSKTIFNFIAQKDMATNISLAHSSRKIAEESRRDNLLSMEIARMTALVAEEARQDSAAMKTIAILTLTFLPGTAVASFFGMEGLFDWGAEPGDPIVSPYIYVYFVITIPLTAIVYAAWFLWFKWTQKQYSKKNENETLQDVEKELRMRVRTATTTFNQRTESSGTL